MSDVPLLQDRFVGCLLGLALGDAFGAPYEGGPLERLVWKAIGRTFKGKRRWTDDTQMALDCAESLIAMGGVSQDDLVRGFARSYRWSRGYGPGAARLLKCVSKGADWRTANRSIYADGSFGNGAGMRAPVVGLFYADTPDRIVQAARASAEVTHAHAQGKEGAVVLAVATASALVGLRNTELLDAVLAQCEHEEFRTRLTIAMTWLVGGEEPPPGTVVAKLGNGMAALKSCVTAVYVAARFLDAPFLAMHRFIVECGGDVDTIGAMAGAVWGASNGRSALPKDMLGALEQCDLIADRAEELLGVVAKCETVG